MLVQLPSGRKIETNHICFIEQHHVWESGRVTYNVLLTAGTRTLSAEDMAELDRWLAPAKRTAEKVTP